MRKIYENITNIIKVKRLTRKEFAQNLINLNPNVNRISETPTLSTIYGYLNGRINIPIDLVPYIAEALNVTEQELFDTSSNTRKKCFKYFLQNASKNELEYFYKFINSQIHNNVNINYGNIIMNTKFLDERIEQFTNLLQYAPENFLEKVINKLKAYQSLDTTDL
jgi:transcriptional regulator with XRE-family HTH domain